MTIGIGAVLANVAVRLSITPLERTHLFEYALVVGLWVPRLRWWFLGLGLLFHALIYVSLSVLTFSALMFVLYLAFVPPDVVDRALHRLVAAPS